MKRYFFPAILVFSLSVCGIQNVQSGPSKKGFDLGGSEIPVGRILDGGPEPDGIPSIDNPVFVSSLEARKLFINTARAIITGQPGALKAYPIPILHWHEIVNDTHQKRPVVVTYCPLAGTGIVFDPRVNDRPLSLGVSGLLYQSALIFFDRDTRSLWPQPLGRAVTRPMKGKKLRIVPSREVPLFPFLDSHPETRVLAPPANSGRNYRLYPYGSYKTDRSVWFPVDRRDTTRHPKEWSMLIKKGQRGLIVPLGEVVRRHAGKVGNQFSITFNGKKFPIHFDGPQKILDCMDVPKEFDCMTGYWFAIRGFFPEAQVYQGDR